MSNKTGGPAFPHMREYVNANTYRPIAEGGMTLRDYFAAKAMQSMMIEDSKETFDDVAELSYLMADAMLKEREVNHDE